MRSCFSNGALKETSLIRLRISRALRGVLGLSTGLTCTRDGVARITEAFVDVLGVPASSVQVWIQETPPESWAQGGVLTADK